MIGRVLVVSACLMGANVVLARAMRAESVPVRESLSAFPMAIGGWQGERADDFDEATLKQLGVDEYVNAAYQNRAGIMGLYIGYYESQRQGDTIHSPANCLPGAGWQPVERSRVQLPAEFQRDTANRGSSPIEINRWVIQKGEDRQVVLYWYQSHGRIVASEYWGKFYLVFDAIRLNRSDGALVRVTHPVDAQSRDPLGEAHARAMAFVKAVLPLLGRFLPA